MKIKIIHTKPEFIDERGGITRVLEPDKIRVKSILRITSKKGTVRANHYHKKDHHWIILEKGKLRYYEKPADKPRAKAQSMLMKAGDMVLTGPNVIHATKFLEDTVFYVFTTEGRDQKKYEKEIIRVDFIK